MRMSGKQQPQFNQAYRTAQSRQSIDFLFGKSFKRHIDQIRAFQQKEAEERLAVPVQSPIPSEDTQESRRRVHFYGSKFETPDAEQQQHGNQIAGQAAQGLSAVPLIQAPSRVPIPQTCAIFHCSMIHSDFSKGRRNVVNSNHVIYACIVQSTVPLTLS